MSEARDVAYAVLNSKVEKDKMSENLGAVRGLFQKSLALKEDQTAGTVLSADMVTLKKPGHGLSADRIADVVGKTLANDVAHDRLLRDDDFIS